MPILANPTSSFAGAACDSMCTTRAIEAQLFCQNLPPAGCDVFYFIAIRCFMFSPLAQLRSIPLAWNTFLGLSLFLNIWYLTRLSDSGMGLRRGHKPSASASFTNPTPPRWGPCILSPPRSLGAFPRSMTYNHSPSPTS